MQRSSDLYVKDIITAIDCIQEFTKNTTKEELVHQEMRLAAVVWKLVIIGEAVSQMADSVKKCFPNIAWNNVRDFRNVVVHQYHRISVDKLWDVIQHELSPLRTQMEKVLGALNISAAELRDLRQAEIDLRKGKARRLK